MASRRNTRPFRRISVDWCVSAEDALEGREAVLVDMAPEDVSTEAAYRTAALLWRRVWDALFLREVNEEALEGSVGFGR